MIRSTRLAAAIAAAVIAGASSWGSSLWSGPLLWAAFIGWASFDNNGANRKALVESSASMLLGVVMAWCVAMVVAERWLPWGPAVSGSLAAGAASLLIVLASVLPALSRVPATFYGFASTFAFLTLVPGAATTSRLTEISWSNGALAVAVSLLIGTGLGVLHGLLGHHLAARSPATASARSRIRLDGTPMPSLHN